MIYFISDQCGHVKIGKADNPIGRLGQLQTGNAHTLILLKTIRCTTFDDFNVENALHKRYAKWIVREDSEWFYEECMKEIMALKTRQEVKGFLKEVMKCEYVNGCFARVEESKEQKMISDLKSEIKKYKRRVSELEKELQARCDNCVMSYRMRKEEV